MDRLLRGKYENYQDLPPIGGYARIYFARTFPKIGIPWWKFVIYGTSMMTVGLLGYKGSQRYSRMIRLEDNDVFIALQPFMMAERDRMWLKQLRHARDLENEVMQNVPGWKTGTWYGEPIYFTLPKDKWWDPIDMELQTHARMRHIKQRKRWSEHDEYAGPHWWDKYLPKSLLDDWVK